MTTHDFVIAYGSHTGQAETISQQLQEKCERLGLRPKLATLNDNGTLFEIEKEGLLVVIVSSTGDGDSPENCARFVRRISRNVLKPDHLSHLSYAILGLGDSNYSTYQGVPKKVDKQLQHLGAKRVIEFGQADDQVGVSRDFSLELVVEPWIDVLMKYLCAQFQVNEEKLRSLETSKIGLQPVKSKEEKDAIAAKQAIGKPDEELTVQCRIPMVEPLDYEYPLESIRKGNDKLSSNGALRVPVPSQPFLCSAVTHEKLLETPKWQNFAPMPGIATVPYDVTVVGTALLTDSDVKKPKREVVVDLGGHADTLLYEPGDAFYFVVPNPEKEVNFILDRSGLLSLADNKLRLAVNPSTEKINPTVPAYIPQQTSLRNLLTYCLDIRRAPGRPLLRVLAESCTDDAEKRRMLELCSVEGMPDFNLHVRQAALTMVDVLLAFPSCRPPIDRLVELLPRLIPRPYSVSSMSGRRLRFIYSVMDFPPTDGRRYHRKGLATEWLISLKVGDIVQIIGKEPARFRLPPLGLEQSAAGRMPLLMVGPGTGVAVFLAFAHRLLKMKLNDPGSVADVPRILMYGCRNVDKDFIHREELEALVREGVLSELIVCESEGNAGRPKYVQDALKNSTSKVCEFLKMGENADNPSRVYICGDAQGMSKQVWQCFHEIVEEGMGLAPADAKKYLTTLKTSTRYIEDVWS